MKKPVQIRAQLLEIMKITALQLIVAVIFSGVSFAYEGKAQELLNQRVKLQIENAKLRTVLDAIESQVKAEFVYSSRAIKSDRKVSLLADGQKLSEILLSLLYPLGISYKVVEGQIILTATEQPQNGTGTPGTSPKLTLDPRVQSPADQTVSGKVTDENGAGLPGVSVLEKGTQRGTTTNQEGQFSIDVTDQSAVLVFSYVGYMAQELRVGSQTRLNVSLAVDAKALNEVVVTAFGIKKDQKSLTYATQQISGKDISAVGNPNVLNGLQGKVAGVTVSLNSGMPGKSPAIRIRGSRSLTGNNEPLYVIDGLPVSGGERILDINPSDIESMNVLKGPAASALYGLRASNGVIVITTKNGSGAQGKPSVTFDTQFSIDQVSFLPDLQMEFAQGENGVFNPNSIFTWGPRISTMSAYTNQLGEQEQPAVYDNDKAFYKNGSTMSSNLAFSNSGAFGNYMIGVGRSDQKGVVPNSSMTRNNVKFNGTFNLLKNLTSAVSFNFSDLSVNDFPEESGNNNIFRGLTETPPSYNLAAKPFAAADDPYRQIFYRVSQNNPYWVINNAFRNEKTKRTLGNILLNYKISDGLALNYRIGMDHFTTIGTTYRELGYAQQGRTNPPSGGSIIVGNQFSNQLNSNLFLTYNKQFNEAWSLDVVAGNEIFDTKDEFVTTNGNNLSVGNWPNLANATLITGSNSIRNQRNVGFYGNVNIGWKDKVYLNASGRNDIVSNMPTGNRSFFYPSLGASAIITELIPASKQIFSFAKLRATVAEVGQAGPLYVNGRGFVANNPGGFVFPYLGLASYAQSGTRISPDLIPENTRTLEVGADIRFLNDRISLDYTYFNSNSNGQIFNVPVPITTGATNEVRNGGRLTSKGHELVLTLIPVQTRDFRWEFNTNFTKYASRVLELYGGTQRVVIGSGTITLAAETSNIYPSFVGTSYVRDPATGQVVYQGNQSRTDYGLPLINNAQKVLGTPTPDFEMNFINRISYKGLTLSAQLDWRSGGLIYNHSLNESLRRGLAGETRDRETQFVPEGKKGTIANGQLEIQGDNDIQINRDRRYYDITWQIQEIALTDASFVRLREVGLTYDLPKKWLSGLKISTASVFFNGRNLFLITKAFTDPEVNMTEGPYSSGNSQGVEVSQIPQTKSYGFGLRIKI